MANQAAVADIAQVHETSALHMSRYRHSHPIHLVGVMGAAIGHNSARACRGGYQFIPFFATVRPRSIYAEAHVPTFRRAKYPIALSWCRSTQPL